jgi:ABC-type nickel/cobalt efflux system permease component RcnA
MRDLQAGGRYVLYAVLFAIAFGGSQGHPWMQGVELFLVIVGVPGYWFWRRTVHVREHDARPSATCSHCRARLARQQAHLELERMEHLNRRYPA